MLGKKWRRSRNEPERWSGDQVAQIMECLEGSMASDSGYADARMLMEEPDDGFSFESGRIGFEDEENR